MVAAAEVVVAAAEIVAVVAVAKAAEVVVAAAKVVVAEGVAAEVAERVMAEEVMAATDKLDGELAQSILKKFCVSVNSSVIIVVDVNDVEVKYSVR